MTALILLAHGSRHPETVPVLTSLADHVRNSLPSSTANGPSHVKLAWLDLVEPSLEQVCAELANDGVSSAIAVPLLFTDAFHSQVDIPQQAHACAHHGIDICVTDGLGLGDGIQRAILRRIAEAASTGVGIADVMIMGVGSSDIRANDEVHNFAEKLDRLLPGRVSASFVVGPPQIKGAEAVAEAAARAERHHRRLIVIPLFTAPGLLWDKVRREAAGRAIFGSPLAELLAPVICCRWDSVTLMPAA